MIIQSYFFLIDIPWITITIGIATHSKTIDTNKELIAECVKMNDNFVNIPARHGALRETRWYTYIPTIYYN